MCAAELLLPPWQIPHEGRDKEWRSSSRRVEPYREDKEKPSGTKRIEQKVVEGGLGWTGNMNNFTGPRHFSLKDTSLNPRGNESYFLEKEMGTKKTVYSASLGLLLHYDQDERRCARPAEEWSLDRQMQRKIRLPNQEDRRNGIGVANPGDKGYATAEHAPEFVAKVLEENRRRGNTQRKVMSKVDKTWSQSGADPLLDKKGRRMCDYIQIYCKTPYRKNSMYVHRNAAVSEIADLAGEGGSRKQHIFFKGKRLAPHHLLLELGIGAKCTVELVLEDEVLVRKAGYREVESRRAAAGEADAGRGLSALDLDTAYPATDREDYVEPAK